MSKSILATIAFVAVVAGCKSELEKEEPRRVYDPSPNAIWQDPQATCSYALPKAHACFNFVTQDWRSTYYFAPMDPVWQLFGFQIDGIPISGYNYFYFPRENHSQLATNRFNPLSPYFQAWFGAYTIKDVNGKTFAIENGTINPLLIAQITIADQIAWLANFAGISHPVVGFDHFNYVTPATSSFTGKSGWEISMVLISNVDVGGNNIGYNNNDNFDVYPYCSEPNFFNADPNTWYGKIPGAVPSQFGYDVIQLDVRAFVYHDEASHQLVVSYTNGIITTNGATLSSLPQINEMLKSVTICNEANSL